MTYELASNAGLLVALSLLYGVLTRRLGLEHPLRPVAVGVLFGGVALLGMAVMTVELVPGVVFDARSVVLSMAGFAGGLPAALVAVGITAPVRALQGGAGLVPGLGTIVSAALLGWGYHALRRGRSDLTGLVHLWGFGLLVHGVVVSWMLVLPSPLQQRVLSEIAPAFLLVFPLGNLLLGRLILDEEERETGGRELRRQERRYRSLVERLPDIVYRYSLRDGGLYWSPGVEAVLGYPPERVRAAPDLWPGAVHPEDAPRVEAALAGAGRGQKFAIEYRIRDAHGAWHWLYDRSIALLAEEGDVVIEGIATDITERKQAEQTLARERERLHHILEGTRTGTWEWNVQTGEVRFNERWAEIIGYRLEELEPLGIDTWTRHAHPEDLEVSNRRLQAHFAGELPYYECEARMRHRDGHWVWVLDRGRLVERTADGRPLRIYGTHTDITERKRHEERLDAAQEELRFTSALVSQAAEPLFAVDLDRDFRFVYVNEATCSHLGYSAAQLLEMSVPDVDPDLDPASLPDLRRRLAEGPLRLETRNRRADGVVVPVEVVAGTVRYGGALLSVGTIRDISARREAEAVTKQARLELEERVQARTRELADANVRLQELDHLKSLFIASMSHELRTPLNSIIGFSGLVLMDAAGPLTDRQRDYLQRVESSGKHLLELINDVIDVSKIESGKLAVHVEEVALGDVAREAARSLEKEAQQKGIEVRLDIPNVILTTDPRRLRQCLLNFISNAVKYSQAGQIRVSAVCGDSTCTVRVQDEGIGITPENQERLFTQFSRIDSPLTRTTPGTGLGLYLTRKLAREVLGGDVGVDSEAGQGSTFWITVPREIAQDVEPSRRG